MKADGVGPDGIPARVPGPCPPDRLAVLLYPDVERYGGGVRDDRLAAELVPAECRGAGSHLLLTPEGRGPDRRDVAAIPLPRYVLRLEVPGPFPGVDGHAFVRGLVGPREETLVRPGGSRGCHGFAFQPVATVGVPAGRSGVTGRSPPRRRGPNPSGRPR